MSDTLGFTIALREWAEVFMHRSMRELRDFTRTSGLSMSQLSTLFHIYHGGACGVSHIGDHLSVTNAAASQMIDRLVQQGLIKRVEDPNDRRAKNITLTDKGLGFVQDAVEARRRWLEDLTVTLTLEQQQAILSALNLLTQAARDLEQTPMR